MVASAEGVDLSSVDPPLPLVPIIGGAVGGVVLILLLLLLVLAVRRRRGHVQSAPTKGRQKGSVKKGNTSAMVKKYEMSAATSAAAAMGQMSSPGKKKSKTTRHAQTQLSTRNPGAREKQTKCGN